MIHPQGAYMLCKHCGSHGLPTDGVDWLDAFKAFLRLHADCEGNATK